MLGLAFATLASLGYVQDPAQPPASPSTPEIQRPKTPAEAPATEPASTEAAPPSVEAGPTAESEAPTPSPGEGEPAAASPSEPTVPAVTEATVPSPAAEAPASKLPEPTSAPLLAPSEDEAPLPSAPRARRSTPPGDTGVSKDEALRRYYAKLYRPADNPVRPNLFVHGGMVVLGSSGTELNGRMGMIGVEAGPAWNKISSALGGDLLVGETRLDAGGDTVSTFGASGQLNLGLGRLGFTRRAILDPRLAYRLTYMPLKAGGPDSPEPSASYMIPHGPEFRLDAAFMISRTREPKFFHVVGINLALQAVVSTIGFDQPVYAAPRIGLVYGFG